jgi:hypothetical protein
LSALAATVAAVGTFLLALLAVAVAISGAVSGEDTKAAEAREAEQLVKLGCDKDGPPTAACEAATRKQAGEKTRRAQERRDEVRRISTSQLIAVSLMLAAFIATLASQLINPVVPPASSASPLADWREVRDRYRQKRRWIEAALAFDAAAASVLLVVGLDVL